MKYNTIRNLQKAGITAGAFLLALGITANVICNENAYQINSALGIETYRLNTQDDTGESNYYPSRFNSVQELKQEGLALCEEVEGEGAVLLKNDNQALPLNVAAGESKISLFGISSVDPLYGGTGSSGIDTSMAPTMKSSFEDAGFQVNEDLWNFYQANKEGHTRFYQSGGYTNDAVNQYAVNDINWDAVTAGAGASFASYGDAAIVTFSRTAGEGSDMPAPTGGTPNQLMDADMNGDYLTLNNNEKSLLKGLADAKGTSFQKIIVLINSANAMETAFLDDPQYKIDAALWIATPGQSGLNAVADILAGTINPSGSLVDTYYTDNQYNPAMTGYGNFVYSDYEQFGMDPMVAGGLNRYVVYQEGIYLGYRYTETRYEDTVLGTPNTGSFDYNTVVDYPFGYGLSYTTFQYSDLTVTEAEGNYTVTVTVTNTGSVAGKESVQIYLQKPYTEYDRQYGVEKAAVELVGYGKTQLLQPGQSEQVSVTVEGKYLASYDANNAKTYIVDAGTYYFTAASDAHAAINNILAAKGKTIEDGMTAAGDASLTWSTQRTFDNTTYAVSQATGAEITNLFDHADLNKYEGNEGQNVVYMSRSNWEGTYPTEPVQLRMTAQMYADMTYDLEPDGEAYPTYGADNGLQLIDLRAAADGTPIAYDDPLWDSFLDQLTWDETVSLLTQGQRITASVMRLGKIQSCDQNGCVGVTQPYNAGVNGLAYKTNDPDGALSGTCYPSSALMAATMNDDLMLRVGDMMGEDCLWAGYSGLYGFGLNIHRTPYSGRNFEYYSEDALLSGKINVGMVQGIQSHGVYVYNKHFALNDQETNRGGVGVWANEQTIRENYLRAFEIPIEESDALCIMTTFARFGVSLATTDYNLITSWARGECGLRGFMVTDTWRAISAFTPFYAVLQAGVDLPDGTVEAEQLNQYSGADGNYGGLAQIMRESAHRVLYITAQSNLMNGILPGSEFVEVMPWWSVLVLAMMAVGAVLCVGSCAATVVTLNKHRKQKASH